MILAYIYGIVEPDPYPPSHKILEVVSQEPQMEVRIIASTTTVEAALAAAILLADPIAPSPEQRAVLEGLN